MKYKNSALPGIFLLCLLSRILFLAITPFNSYELFGDSLRYDMLSSRIIAGDYDLGMVAFIIAPLYPWTIALLKVLSPEHWTTLLTALQFLLISVSAVYIFRLAVLLFKNEKAAWISAILYIIYPLGLWYNFTFVQENFFQAFFILFSFYFLRSLTANGAKSVLPAFVFYMLCFFTKFHVILLLPGIFLLLRTSKSIWMATLFILAFLAAATPNALLNYKIHDAFSFTGFAFGSLFLSGHSDETYKCLSAEIYNHPEIIDSGCNLDLVFHPPYSFEKYGQVNMKPWPQRNRERLLIGLEWIRNNPVKFMELKWNGIWRLLVPGLDHRIYPALKWWTAFIYGLVFTLPAYIVMYRSLRQGKRHSYYVLTAFLSVAFIFLVFYPQNRFRVIGLEPLWIVYAGAFYAELWDRFRT